jgi:hypothetical protein
MGMPFITFIYRIGKRTYYGKCDMECISDDHEGLDDEVRPALMKGIAAFRAQQNLPPLTDPIRIGILSLSFEHFIPVYSSEKEMEAFDFYHIEDTFYHGKTYVNGKLIIST